MKITIEIDCTPEEARRCLGLPDLQPLQAALLDRVQRQIAEVPGPLAPDALLRLWATVVPQMPDAMRTALAPFLGAAETGRGRPE
jgi:hypothetical protein